MENLRSPEDLMRYIAKMNKDNSVGQIFIPGKGKFTIVLQEEDQRTIADEVKSNPELKQMIHESMEAYKDGRFMKTSELLNSLSSEDFSK
jgi:hypothetical protein